MTHKMVRLIVSLTIAVIGLNSVTHSSAAGVPAGQPLRPTAPSAVYSPVGLRKLSQPLGEEGSVHKKQLSADGSSVVYMASGDGTSRTELFRVSLSDGAIIKLNSALSRDVENFAISPDSTRVVYSAGHTADEVMQLYSVPIGGGTPIRLSALTENASIDFTISPDSSRVIYNVYPYSSVSKQRDLYSVPLLGGANALLNTPLASERDGIESFTISPDSTRVIYSRRTVTDTNETSWELYRIAITGGTPTLVDTRLGHVLISPDSSQIVYTRTATEPWKTEGIYHVAVSGGTPSIYQNSDRLGLHSMAIDSTSTYVVFIISHQGQTTDLYRVPLGGGTSLKLNLPLQAGEHVQTYQFTPDGSRVVYGVGTNATDAQSNSRMTALYSVSIAGGDSTQLNGVLDPNGTGIFSYRISPDSQYIVYKADQETFSDTLHQLYSVPIDASTAPVKLNGPLLPAGEWYKPDVGHDYMITPDSKAVLYRAETTSFGMANLFSVSISGGMPFKLNGSVPNVRQGFAERFQIAPNSQDVVFLGTSYDKMNNTEITELYAANVVLITSSVYLPLVQR